MIDRHPSDFFGDTSANANYYSQVLAMMEEQLREGGPSELEETLRRYYLPVGWRLYSFDKLIASIVRFATAVVGGDSKDKTWDVYQLFRKDRTKNETTRRDELNYRKQVEKHVKEGDVYRVVYVS